MNAQGPPAAPFRLQGLTQVLRWMPTGALLAATGSTQALAGSDAV